VAHVLEPGMAVTSIGQHTSRYDTRAGIGRFFWCPSISATACRAGKKSRPPLPHRRGRRLHPFEILKQRARGRTGTRIAPQPPVPGALPAWSAGWSQYRKFSHFEKHLLYNHQQVQYLM